MPDLTDATSIAQNVVPITQESYGPFYSLAPYSSNAVDSQCIGGVVAQSNAGAIAIFAGTTDKLYEMTGTSNAWVDVSGGSYSTNTGDSWRFVSFAYTVIATNYGNPMQSFTIGTSSVFGPLFTAPAWAQSTAYSVLGSYILAGGLRYVLTQAGTSSNTGAGPIGTGVAITDGTCIWNYQSSAPPLARFICTPKSFVMVANTYDPIGGLGPQRAWWCASGDATSWPAPGSNAAITGMSDYNDFPGSYGPIVGIVDSLANADVAVFFRHAVWRGVFVGPPDVFDFFPAENVRGCPAFNSIVPLGSLVYFLGEDGFYMFDGGSSTPIGVDKFDKWFWSNVNQAFLWNVIGAPDIVNKAIIWIFPSIYSGSGVPDTALIYRWDIQRAATVALGAGTVAWIMRTLSLGTTLDGLASLGFNDLDTIPMSLDSPVFVGGAAQLAAVSGAGNLAYFNGTAMAATVGTNTVQLTPGRRTYVQSARPLVEAVSGTPTISFSGRVNLYDREVFGSAVAPDISGECPQRSDARYHNALVAMPAGAVWSHITGVDVTSRPAGLR